MKRYLFNILVFFAIVAAVDFGVSVAGDYLQAHAKSGDTKRIDDLVMRSQHDIVILGSSRAHHHYDTPFLCDTLGLDLYNAGYDGNGVVLATGILDMIVQRYRPKLVLFDVEPVFDIYVYENDKNHVRYINNLKPYYCQKNIGDIIRDVSMEEWCKVNSGMLRYNTSIILMLKENMVSTENQDYGYEPLKGIYTGEPLVGNDNDILDSFKLAYVEKLINTAHSNNVPIAFVASPKYAQSKHDVLKPVKDICELRNVEFINYYDKEFFMAHKELFKEPMHLNETGARIFSILIAQDINRLLQRNGNQ